MESGMKRFVTTDDLTLLLKKAPTLWKLAESARKISADLDEDKENMKAANESIKRGQKRLRTGGLTKKQRAKIERQIEYHDEWLSHAEEELKEKCPTFSEAISQIESVLRELADKYEELGNVHRFKHG
jgi:uncharacterized phage infection (PIP) family protein YhgE